MYLIHETLLPKIKAEIIGKYSTAQSAGIFISDNVPAFPFSFFFNFLFS